MEKSLISLMLFYYCYIIAFMFFMFKKRKQAIIKKEVHHSHFKSYRGETTEYLQIIQNHFNNQFQIPTIFFVVCVLCIAMNKVSYVTIFLALAFVVSRIIHSLIHLGSNHLIKRAMSYFTGVVIVAVMIVTTLY